MAGPYLISKPNPATLVLKESRSWHASALRSHAGFLIVWFIGLLAILGGVDKLVDRVVQFDWFAILFVAVPLLSLAYGSAKVIGSLIHPRIITFDSDTSRIVDGGRLIAFFEDVAKIQIKVNTSGDSDRYELGILTKNSGTLRVWDGYDYDLAFELADEMAEKIGTKVEKTS
jgi:hypothetical protein